MAEDDPTTCIKAAIEIKLRGLTTINAHEDQPRIFKVHKQLLKVNENAYKPMLLAIGPYNDHQMVGQGLMEEHKLRHLKQMLDRRIELSLEDYINALRALEVRARNCYAERIPLEPNQFVEMMLLDGCFIIELFRMYKMWNLRDEYNPIFQMSWMLPEIARDLMLFENQLPYFVLTKLFEMSENPSRHSGEHIVAIEQSGDFGDHAICFFSYLLPFQGWEVKRSGFHSAIKPLKLFWTHKAITPRLANMVHDRLVVEKKFMNAEFEHLLDLIHTMIRVSILDMELHRATKLQEVVVIFKMGEIFKHLFGLIYRVVSPLHVTMEDGQESNEDWDTIPWGTELRQAEVQWKMAQTFKDKYIESILWEFIPDGAAFHEAGVEFEKAEKVVGVLAPNRNEYGKSKLCGALLIKVVEKFMCLPCLNKIENWDSIPHGKEFKDAGIEFKKAKKFRDIKNMINSPKPNATELKEAGVKFKKGKKNNMFAIKFSNGVLEISPLTIEDETETFMRNLIAYEQYRPYSDSKYVSDYILMLDDLIDSPKDVELLRRKGIIENYLGNDECASNMVNKLGRHVTLSSRNSIYDKTSIEMNKHCEFVWNEWKAKLRHDYFNSPWALLSVVAAISLLGLAITQTVFSIIH
ncbi:hypothetical protein F2P56_014968 [Juglans regia]|uniref:Uncharacterized protein n=2 Tax=Juglans regia TaxID=51240 RepID=A0A834CUV2_JUGRE|nr:UPF0481 protein At3g47200-like [Juglans regia]KAF5464931.1 hypothetical protein F2P56_014968 [Juglans regia]